VDSYYYPVAALPLINYDSDPPFTLEEYIDHCTPWLSKEHVKIIKNLAGSIITPGENRLLDSWNQWDISYRNNLVKLRAVKLGLDPEKYQKREGDLWYLEEKAREAFQQESPLVAEETILKAQWDYLSQLEKDHYFDLEILIIYLLKLKILLRRSGFQYNLGKTNFEELYKNYHTNRNESKAGE